MVRKKSKPRSTKSKLVNQRGRLRVRCPIHKNEEMHRLGFSEAVKKKKTKKNKRGISGVHISTQWFYCKKCDKPRKINFVIAN